RKVIACLRKSPAAPDLPCAISLSIAPVTSSRVSFRTSVVLCSGSRLRRNALSAVGVATTARARSDCSYGPSCAISAPKVAALALAAALTASFFSFLAAVDALRPLAGKDGGLPARCVDLISDLANNLPERCSPKTARAHQGHTRP